MATDSNDIERLAEIAALDLTSPEVDNLLQEIAARAAQEIGLPISLVSIVLDEAQYFAALHGVAGWMAEARGTPIEWSFCAHAVRSGQPFIVEDAEQEPLVQENPLVKYDGIRCYAGIPLRSSRGYALGTLCVIGKEPRTFTEEEVETLHGLAAEAVARIEARRH